MQQNAAPAYCARKHTLDAVEDYELKSDIKSRRKLVTAVLNHQADFECMAQTRASAIMGYEASLPLLTSLKQHDSLHDATQLLQQADAKLKEWSCDISSLFDGTNKLFPDNEKEKKHEEHARYMAHVRERCDTDHLTMALLRRMCIRVSSSLNGF